jgi:hypothetical protein
MRRSSGFMLWLLDAREAVAFFDAEIAAHRERPTGFEQTFAEDERQRRTHGTARGGSAFCAALAPEWGIRYEREYMPWATQARHRIARGAKPGDDARGQHLDF